MTLPAVQSLSSIFLARLLAELADMHMISVDQLACSAGSAEQFQKEQMRNGLTFEYW